MKASKVLRLKLAKNKHQLRTSTPHFNPREAYGAKLKIGGMPIDQLSHKQHVPGYRGYDYGYW